MLFGNSHAKINAYHFHTYIKNKDQQTSPSKFASFTAKLPRCKKVAYFILEEFPVDTYGLPESTRNLSLDPVASRAMNKPNSPSAGHGECPRSRVAGTAMG